MNRLANVETLFYTINSPPPPQLAVFKTNKTNAFKNKYHPDGFRIVN